MKIFRMYTLLLKHFSYICIFLWVFMLFAVLCHGILKVVQIKLFFFIKHFKIQVPPMMSAY